MTKVDPRIECSKFHREYHPYSREQSTTDLINAAYKKGVSTGPVLYANVGIEVELLDSIDDPLEFFRTVGNETWAQKKLDDIIDPAVRNAITSHELIETVRNSNRS